ncbi:hypothetical protein GQ43DRAFT_440817 [Delitschia confertaspora ATCC 74209]|uniref:Uncharacterized protein n=1 Tax=Delitschia confertaspora ATCC 74209 TaxID=1513339 RepID=A0A9P4JQC0_9PLEO|nr:hypothetical protein GQ43DRAFT_440817 [Delitschia confertaspora ATCC 74209]
MSSTTSSGSDSVHGSTSTPSLYTREAPPSYSITMEFYGSSSSTSQNTKSKYKNTKPSKEPFYAAILSYLSMK